MWVFKKIHALLQDEWLLNKDWSYNVDKMAIWIYNHTPRTDAEDAAMDYSIEQLRDTVDERNPE